MSVHCSAVSEESNSALRSQEDSIPGGSSNVNHMPKQSSESIGLRPLFMETLRRLILEQFNQSTSLPEGSLAKTSQMLENELESRGVVLHSGNITCKRLGFYDRNTQSLRTFQQSLVGDSMLCLQTLPRSGMMRNGIVYQLPPLVRITAATDCSLLPMFPTITSSFGARGAIIQPFSNHDTEKGLRKAFLKWPTPNCADAFTDKLKSSQQKEGSMHSVNLSQAVRMFPTVTKSDFHMRHKSENWQGHDLCSQVWTGGGGQLNPTWVEWLMGFPLGWTELNASETLSFRNAHKSSRKQSRKEKNTINLYICYVRTINGDMNG
jgi:hypothetical protein